MYAPMTDPTTVQLLARMPAWVPVLFVLLLVLGYRQSFTRTVRPAVLAVLAAGMFSLSLYGVVAAFGASSAALALWFACYALTVVVATKRMSRAGMVAVGGVVRVPGSWVPLALLMGLFAVKFALGVAAGIRSPLLDDPAVVAAASASLGLLGGGFGARAMAVHGVARTAVGA